MGHSDVKQILRNTVKTTARRLLVKALGAVPLASAIRVRDSYATAPEGTIKRRLLDRAMFLLKYKDLSSLIDHIDVPGDPGFRLAVCHSVIVNRLFFFGAEGYESAESAVWRQLCCDATRIVELGANIGLYTVQGALAAPSAEYVAVEPHPGNLAILRQNIGLNGLENVDLVDAAVVGTKTSETLQLCLPADDFAAAPLGSFLSEASAELERPTSVSIEVRVVTAADVLAGADLIKLDVEGLEYAILASVLEPLIEARPTLLVEVLEHAAELRGLLHELCEKHGYHAHCFTADGLVEISAAEVLQLGPKGRYLNRDAVFAAAPLRSDGTRREP